MQIISRKASSLFPRSTNEFFEVSSVAFHSNNQWCSSSSYATVSSDSFTPQQGRQKVTKQQRTAMALAFVEKYRALNGGKFPSVSVTQNEIGGSYYVIKLIVQKLEYNYKKGLLETKKEVKISEENTKCEASPLSFKEIVGDYTEIRKRDSSNNIKANTKASRLSIETRFDNQIEVNTDKQLSSSSKESLEDKCLGFDNLHDSSSSDVVTIHAEYQVPAKEETETIVLHTPTEGREVTPDNVYSPANLQDACHSEGKEMRAEVLRSEELYRVDREKVELGSEATNSSTFWNNLKFMAVGILNLWKK